MMMVSFLNLELSSHRASPAPSLVVSHPSASFLRCETAEQHQRSHVHSRDCSFTMTYLHELRNPICQANGPRRGWQGWMAVWQWSPGTPAGTASKARPRFWQSGGIPVTTQGPAAKAATKDWTRPILVACLVGATLLLYLQRAPGPWRRSAFAPQEKQFPNLQVGLTPSCHELCLCLVSDTVCSQTS